MKNLLKKKKVNIIKNYNINVKNQKLFDEYKSVEIGKHFEVEENEESYNEKLTGAFGCNLKSSDNNKRKNDKTEFDSDKKNLNSKKIKEKNFNEKNNPYSIYNDDFANKFIETDNSDINFLSENLKENPKFGRKLKNSNESIKTKEENCEDDPNLEKLKKSLDSYSKHKNINKFNTMGTTPRSDIDTGRFTLNNNKAKEKDFINSEKERSKRNPIKNNRDESDIFDFVLNKDQTLLNKNDISDTVNVYEKIFKDVKNENKSEKEGTTYNVSYLENNRTNNYTEKDLVNYNYDTKSNISEKGIYNVNKNNTDLHKKNSDKILNEKSNYSNIDHSVKKDISTIIPKDFSNIKKKDIPVDLKLKEETRKIPAFNNEITKNNNVQGESVIFLNNLEYEKEEFKDLNNFFSPQSRLDEINNQNQNQIHNQSNLSSFNNHNTTENAPTGNNNMGSFLTDGKTKVKNSNFANKQNKEPNQSKINDTNSNYQKNSIDNNISQNNLLEYFDYKSKLLNDDSSQKIKSNERIDNNIDKNLLEENNIDLFKKENLFNNIDAILNQTESFKKDDKKTNILSESKDKKTDNNKENILLKDKNEEKLKKLHEILESTDNEYKIDNRSSVNRIIDYRDNYKYDINNPTLNYTNINNTNTAEILNMALELKEGKKTIISMKEIIDELKKESKAKDETYKRQIEEKLAIQKFEFEKHLDKQKEFIESLILEKKKHSANAAELTEKLESAEKSGQKKVSQMMQNFELELKKNKDAWFQAEKMRRKKWEETKIKEIKEMTIKGMEPEFQRILERNKHEVQMLEDKALNDQRKLREKLTEEFERRLNDAKDRFGKEKEEALEHERNIASQRLRNQNERIEEEYGEERKRWNSKIGDEVQRLEKLRENDKKIYEDQIAKIEERNLKLLEEKENFYKLKISEMEKRFDDKIQTAQNDLIIKFAKEKEKFIEEKTKDYEHKFKETKHDLIKDRDKQLQLVIDKLGEETLAEKKKMLMECEAKADIINKQLRQENEIMIKKIQDLSDKLSAETKVRIMLDNNLDTLSRKIQEKETLLTKKEAHVLEINSKYNEISDKYTSIAREFSKEKIEVEHDFKSKIQKMESEIKLAVEKNETLKIQYNNKLTESQKEYEEEISKIEGKIKNTLSKKDDVIKKLQEDSQVKELTIKKLEELLEKQRKELLMNK